MSSPMSAGRRPKFWVPGDWNAFFGFGTNILVNVLALTTLLRFVMKMPDALVFGRILPATGLMLFLRRCTTPISPTAWPRRPAGPTCARCPRASACRTCSSSCSSSCCRSLGMTKDPMQAWEAGLTWVFVQSFVLMAGGFVGPLHPQDHAPRRPARVARRHLDHLHLDAPGRADVRHADHRRDLLRHHPRQLVRRRPLLQAACPAGLVAIAVGTVIAWVSDRNRAAATAT